VHARKGLADNRDTSLVRVEETTSGEAKVQGGEDAGIGTIDCDFAAAIDEAGTDIPPDGEPRDSYALDAGDPGQAIAKHVEVLSGGGIFVSVCVQVGRERKGSSKVETRIEDKEICKAPHELAGNDEEDATGCDLADEKN
jgi:hypothetical protein